MKTEIAKKLGTMSLFAEFTELDIATLLEISECFLVKKGENIVTQDTVGDAMFVIVDGSAKVMHRSEGKRVQLALLEAGDLFGELALVDQGPRSADVEAEVDCTLLKIPEGSIHALAGVYPAVAFKFLIAVARVVVKRMRFGNKKYIDSLLLTAGNQE